MNWTRVRAVIARELLEVRQNRTLLLTIFGPPLLLTILPLGIMAFMGAVPERNNMRPEDIARYVEAFPELKSLGGLEVIQIIIMRQFLLMYLILPLMVPTSIATASIIGEKEVRSLEPLLATPVRTEELLLGKSIAAVVPAVASTWFAYAVFFIGARFVSLSDLVFAQLLSPIWLLAIIVLAPLLALLSVNLSVIISSRVNDARVAQQLASMLVIPIVALSVGQTMGFVALNVVTFLVATVVVILVDLGAMYAGVMLFQREAILTRWK
ncbi:MAG: ABC transporter permease subunit [Chloroflexi bacterium]|nr:ABC transporter permease subunit [Chloroflexota bacterium]